MTTARIETFADGVFAIAATLLILDVTADAPGGRLGHALVHAWPSYGAYAVSFVTIGIMWVNHHACFEQVGRADRTFLFLNVGLLACVAFVPYPTRLVADHLHDDGLRAAALAYGLTMVSTSVFFVASWLYAAIGRRLLAADADDRVVRGITRSFRPGVAMYGGATLLALWSPTAAVILFAAIAAFYVLESSLFAGGEGTPLGGS